MTLNDLLEMLTEQERIKAVDDFVLTGNVFILVSNKIGGAKFTRLDPTKVVVNS